MVRIPTAHSAADLHDRLQTFRRESTFSAKRIPLTEVDTLTPTTSNALDTHLWQKQSKSGDIARGDGLFFQVGGTRVTSNSALGKTYDQPMLAEVEKGVVALVVDEQTGDYLLDMKAEPGNDLERGHVALAPTLQTSHGRLALAAKNVADTAPSLLSALIGLGLDTETSAELQQDGGRFWQKRNTYQTLGVPNKEAMDNYGTASMMWVKPAYLGAKENVSDCNSHLAQCIGVQSLASARKRDENIQAVMSWASAVYASLCLTALQGVATLRTWMTKSVNYCVDALRR